MNNNPAEQQVNNNERAKANDKHNENSLHTLPSFKDFDFRNFDNGEPNTEIILIYL